MTSQERLRETSSSLVQMPTRNQRRNDKKKTKKNEGIMISDVKKGSEVKCTVAIVQHHSSLDWSVGTHDRHAIILLLRIMSTNVLALFPVNLLFFCVKKSTDGMMHL